MSAQLRDNSLRVVGSASIAQPLLGCYCRVTLRRVDGIQREHGLVPTQARNDSGGGVGGAARVLEIRSTSGGERRHIQVAPGIALLALFTWYFLGDVVQVGLD